jgi:hypothetical protein
LHTGDLNGVDFKAAGDAYTVGESGTVLEFVALGI